jgi:hypothetical protein
MNIHKDLPGGFYFKLSRPSAKSTVRNRELMTRADLTTESCIQLAIKHL